MFSKFDRYFDLCIAMRKKFQKANSIEEQESIIKEFIDKLKDDNLSNDDIIKILNYEAIMESQGNREMISNNSMYQAAIAKALGNNK